MIDIRNENQTDMPPIAPGESKRRVSWKGIFVFVIIILLGAVGWYLYQEFSQPAEGTVRVVAPKADLANPDLPPALVTHEKRYFKLTLLENYEDKARETNIVPGATLREQAYFSDPTGNLRKIAVTIDEKPGITPEDLTSYTYRKSHPETYQEKKLSLNNQKVVIFEKNDPVYEIVAYIPEDRHLMASIAIISAYETPEKLIGDFSETLSLFEWKE